MRELLPTLHLAFSLWGAALDPDAISDALGVPSTSAHRAGEGRQAQNPRAVHGKDAFWSWRGPPADDPEPLLDQWHDLFAPRAEVLRGLLHDDDSVYLTLVGTVPAWPVMHVEQIAGMHIVGDAVYPRYNPDHFEPFLDADRIPLVLDLRHLDLLARLRCTFGTHIDYVLLTEDKPPPRGPQ